MKATLGSSILAFLTVADLTHALSLRRPLLEWPTKTRDAARSGTLERRQESSGTSIPAAINIAPSQYWEGIDGPWSSFPIQVGPPNSAQNVRVFVSTVAYNTITISEEGCPSFYQANIADCGNSRGGIFYPNESLSWVQNSDFQLSIEDNLGLDTSAAAGFDTVTLGWQGSGGPSMNHSVVFNSADNKPSWLGLFGVNPMPTNFTTFVDPQPSFLYNAYNTSIIPSLSYAYTAGNQYRLGGLKVFGSLVLGGYDQDRFTSTGISFPMYTDVSRDLLVNLQSVTTDAGSPTNLLPSGRIQVFLDSTIAYIYLPQDACEAFESAFGITYDETYDFYLVTAEQRQAMLSQNANVTFKISAYNDTAGASSVDIVFPYQAFDLNISYPLIGNNGTAASYYFPLKRAANSTQYTFGRTFFQEAYLISDYQRNNFTVAPCAWDQTTVNTPSIKSILSPEIEASVNKSGSSGLTGGAIAGIVVGVVGGIAIIGLIAFFWMRRRKTEKKRIAELEAKSAAGGGNDDKDSSDENDTKPKISAPIGGELGTGGEIHEMNAPHKYAAQEMDSPHKLDPHKTGYSEVEGSGYFAPSKLGAAEMQGSTPIFEMPGSEVQELQGSQVYGHDRKE